MSKNGKGFEKFLREYSSNVNSQIAYRSDLSPRKPVVRDKEKDKTQFFKNAPELGTPEGDAYSAGEKLLTAIKEKKPQDEIEAAAKTAREANVAVSDTKRISPSYWVTQKDFQDAFGRRYDAMSEQDRQDFFNLVGSSQPRRYTEGPAAGQIIPSTRRPEYIPTFQDVDGVRVPESAFSRLKKVTPETADERETVKIGQYEIKPVYPEAEQKQARARNFTNVEQMRVSDEIALQAPVIPLEQRPEGGNKVFPPAPAPDPAPAPAPDPAPAPEPPEQESSVVSDIEYAKMMQDAKKAPSSVGSSTFPGIPSSVASLIAMYKPKLAPDAIAAVDVDGPPRSEAERSKMMRDAREAPSAVGPSTFPGIPSSVASLIAAYSPAPAPAPDPAPAPLPTPTLSQGEDGLPQFPDQFSKWYPPTVGPRQTPSQLEPQSGRSEPIIEFEPAPPPTLAPDAIAGVDVEGPPRSEAERSKMMRDAQEELPKGFKSWSEYNDVILQQMAADEMSGSSEGLGAGVRSPSGFEQAMRLAQGVGQFARNLDQAAGRKVRESGQKISDIAKRFRTQRDENARKNIERLEAQGIRVPGFDTGEKGFGQRNVQQAEAGLDTEGPPPPAPEPKQNSVQVQMFTDEEKRQNIIQAYRELLGLDPLSSLRREAELRQMMKEVEEMRKRGEILPGSVSAAPRRGIELEDGMQMPKDIADAIRRREESRRKKSERSAPVEGGMNVPVDIADFEPPAAPVEGGMNVPVDIADFEPPAVPQTVAAQISKEEKPKNETTSPISPEMASKMLQVQTPGQAPIQKPAQQIGITPQSVAEYMKTVPAVRQITAKPDAMRQRITPKQGVMSFTAGMSEAEVDQEFERIFGKPTSQRLSGLSLNSKRDMIGRYKLKQAGEE